MDTELLVEERIDGGQKLIDQLVRDGFDVRVAFWVKASEGGVWHLYIASPAVSPEKVVEAFRTVYASLSKLADPWVSHSEVKLLNGTDPAARAAVEIRDRLPGKSPTRYHGKRLGNLTIEEAYIYPPPGKWFNGFDEIKRNFPSAEVFIVPILFKDAQPATYGPLIGYVNAAEFEGKARGTVMFFGPRASSSKPVGELVFVYRPEGWNTLYRADTKRYEEVRHVPSGEPLYRFADFSPLAALKTERRPGDENIDRMKHLLAQGYYLTIPPDETPIRSIPYTPPANAGGPPPKPVGWDDIRRVMEEGGWINIHPPAKKETA
jgi:hypothetical protein